MKSKVLLVALFITALSGNVQALKGNPLSDATSFVRNHANPMNVTFPVLALVLIGHPIVNWVKDRINKVEGNGFKELLRNTVSASAGMKGDAAHELKLHLGSAEAKLTSPTVESFPLGKKERSINELLYSLRPQVDCGFAAESSPVTGEDAPDVTRMYGRFSLGEWSMHLGCDLKDLLMIPAAMIAVHLVSQVLPTISSCSDDTSAC